MVNIFKLSILLILLFRPGLIDYPMGNVGYPNGKFLYVDKFGASYITDSFTFICLSTAGFMHF